MTGIQFDQYHTERDWRLRWISSEISMPESDSKTISVPGMDGVIDLTESLTGRVTYKPRVLSFTFDCPDGDMLHWHTYQAIIAGACHGKTMQITLDHDKGYYYVGRVAVSFEKKNLVNSTVTFTITAEPYKYEAIGSAEDWLWDSFNFYTGIIRAYKELAVSGTRTLTVIGTAKPMVPTITCSAAMILTAAGKTYRLAVGTNRDSALPVLPGKQEWIFTGTGNVSIAFRGVSL